MKKIIIFLITTFILSCSILVNKPNDKNVIKEVSQSIVRIHVEHVRPITMIETLYYIIMGKDVPDTITDRWSGSGSVLNKKEGYIVTNAHVAPKQDNTTVHVKIDGVTVLSEVLYNHKIMDLSVVKVHPHYLRNKRNITFAKSYRVGEEVGILGHPIGLENSFSFGYISAFRIFDDGRYIQTDCLSNPGNSGGLAFNKYGEFIGIPTAGYVLPGRGATGINLILDGKAVKKALFYFLDEPIPNKIRNFKVK